MANENNKINELIRPDEDMTSELEALTWQQTAPFARREELESDAQTCELRADRSDPDPQIAQLKKALSERTDAIDGLLYDVEQWRARFNGLKAEVAAREELTNRLRDELAEAHDALARKDRLLQKRDQALKALKDEIGARDEQARVAESREEALQEALAEKDRAIDSERQAMELEMSNVRRLEASLDEQRLRIAELEYYIDNRKQLWEENQQAMDRLRDELTGKTTVIARQSAELEKAGADIAALRGTIEAQHRQITEKDESLRTLEREVRRLTAELEAPVHEELEQARREIAALTGRLASRDTSIANLGERLQRTESYADSLRRRIADQDGESLRLREHRDTLEQAVKRAAEDLAARQSELHAERDRAGELEARLQEQDKRHGDEIRMLRFELSEAEETVSQQELISEQLASDLVDSRGFKENLERMLDESEQRRRTAVEELERQIERLKKAEREHREQLATKSEAINALLTELSAKGRSNEPDAEEPEDDLGPDLDERPPERAEERPAGDRDRVSRVLIGTNANQELRFPLFKDRLTIGRTRQNDIQLKAPFVSRRHAVIVTDGDATRVIDWGSKNGIYVNSSRVSEHFLRSGDILTIGTANFRYEERHKRES